MGISWLPEERRKELLIDYTKEMLDIHQWATAQAACRIRYRQATVQGSVSGPWHERVAKTRANFIEPGSSLPDPGFATRRQCVVKRWASTPIGVSGH